MKGIGGGGVLFSSKLLLTLHLYYKISFLISLCVLHHNLHHVDLSVSQAGLPCSCVYPYVPDCSARE